MDNIPHGVAIDPRLEHEKARDYLHINIYSGLPVNWVEIDPTKLVLTSPRYQDGSYSCIEQSSATAMEKLTSNVISASTYRLRSNYPSPGMWLQNAGDIAKNIGFILETDSPSQNQSEASMNNVILPKKYKIKAIGYAFCSKNIDEIAQAVQAYGQCLITFNSNSAEWTITPTYYGQPTTFGHCICALNYGLIKGVKTLVCRDSSGSSSIRYITEDFLNQRNTGAMYFTGVTLVPDYSWFDNFVNWLKSNK